MPEKYWTDDGKAVNDWDGWKLMIKELGWKISTITETMHTIGLAHHPDLKKESVPHV